MVMITVTKDQYQCDEQAHTLPACVSTRGCFQPCSFPSLASPLPPFPGANPCLNPFPTRVLDKCLS